MEGEARYIVYGREFLCNLDQISEPIKEILVKILNFNHKRLDISKLLKHSEDVCAEIEHIGQTLVALAGRLREKILAEKNCGNQSSVQAEANHAPQSVITTNNTSVSLCNDIRECDELDQLKVTVEREKNNKIQSAVDELSALQEERLTKLEEQVKKAEGAINEKLKVKIDRKKLDRKKEQVQKVFKTGLGHVYSKPLQKNEQGHRKPSTPRPPIVALPQCKTKITEQGYEHIRLHGSPVPTKSLREKKEELQLQEEIKWSRITPMPVRGTRARNHHNLSFPQKKA